MERMQTMSPYNFNDDLNLSESIEPTHSNFNPSLNNNYQVMSIGLHPQVPTEMPIPNNNYIAMPTQKPTQKPNKQPQYNNVSNLMGMPMQKPTQMPMQITNIDDNSDIESNVETNAESNLSKLNTNMLENNNSIINLLNFNDKNNKSSIINKFNDFYSLLTKVNTNEHFMNNDELNNQINQFISTYDDYKINKLPNNIQNEEYFLYQLTTKFKLNNADNIKKYYNVIINLNKLASDLNKNEIQDRNYVLANIIYIIDGLLFIYNKFKPTNNIIMLDQYILPIYTAIKNTLYLYIYDSNNPKNIQYISTYFKQNNENNVIENKFNLSNNQNLDSVSLVYIIIGCIIGILITLGFYKLIKKK